MVTSPLVAIFANGDKPLVAIFSNGDKPIGSNIC